MIEKSFLEFPKKKKKKEGKSKVSVTFATKRKEIESILDYFCSKEVRIFTNLN